MCKFSTNSPEPLAAHMIIAHWKDSWTIRIENTPHVFKLATKGIKNQVQTKSMGNIPKHTEKATEIETNSATETMPGKKKTINTKTRNNEKTKHAIRPMDATITQAVEPSNTRKAIKIAAMKAMRAMRATAEVLTCTKNLINIAQNTEPNNNEKTKEITNPQPQGARQRPLSMKKSKHRPQLEGNKEPRRRCPHH